MIRLSFSPTMYSLLTPSSPYPDSSLTPTPTIAFTTPTTYATGLSHLLHRHNYTPLSCPTVVVEPTAATNAALLRHLAAIDTFSSIAFTSRSGIAAVETALSAAPSPPLSPVGNGEPFVISALGNDAELLTLKFIAKLCGNQDRIRVLVPSNATPSGLVESLGTGRGRRILCPVPRVVGLEEPPVVPDFLEDLGLMGWVPVRADAYETRWAGPKCVEKLVEVDQLDGVIFTSTAEVEGLLKGLRELGLGWAEMRKRWPGLVVAAHGPVTASGAERLGVRVDVVGSNFSTFDGVVEALNHVLDNMGHY